MPQDSLETPSSAATPVATGLRDGVALGAARFMAAGLAVVAQGALLRITDDRNYGRYSTFLLVANLAIAFTTWPVGSVLRLGTDEWVASKRLARTFVLHVWLVLGAAALLAAPFWEAREVVDRYVEVQGAAWIILAYALVTALANVSAAVLKPAGRVAQFAVLPLLTRIAYVGALVWIAHAKQIHDARTIMLVCLASALPQLGVGVLLIARLVWPPSVPEPREGNTAVRFGVPVLLRQLGAQAFAYVNLVVIRSAQGIVAMGWLNLPNALAEQTALLAVAFEDLMGPILARAAAEKDERRLQTYYRSVAPQVALVWSTACGVAILLAHPVLGALHAKNIDLAIPAFQILLLATAVRIVISLEAPVFDAHLISGPPLAFFLIAFGTNFGLDVVLVPRYGIMGLVWASVVGWTLNVVLRGVYLSVRFRVPSLVLLAYVVPAPVALGYARLVGGTDFENATAAIVFSALALLVGRMTGVFSPASLAALEGVRMPARVRAFVGWFYGAKT